MAKIIKNHDSWHKITISGDRADGEILLVTGGRRAYLWCGDAPFAPHKRQCATFSGAATLRKLARAILSEVGK